MKMSKSLGNTISPIDLIRDSGADILRLWALSVDFTEDHRIGKEILAGVSDQYRKLRNTFRYLLGALEGFSDAEAVSDIAEMPELERYMLSLLAELDAKLRQAVDDFDFNSYTRLLSDFANNDLSAFFFDIRKDSLYCDALDSIRRRSYRTVLDAVFHALVRWAAPELVFTAEEVWSTRFPDTGSVHLLEWPDVGDWLDPKLVEEFELLRALRSLATNSIEPLRRDKKIGSSLEADVYVAVPPTEMPHFNEQAHTRLPELFISSSVNVVPHILTKHGFERPAFPDGVVCFNASFPGYEVTSTPTSNHKCGRCWRHLPEVTEDGDLCNRCEDVVGG
jgi:isoleucyl-tRNA synthetase